MKTMYKVLFVTLILCVPFISIIGAGNIVLRMPDVYGYQFNDIEFTKNNGLEMENQQLADYISDFMFDKKDKFELHVNYEGQKSSIFTDQENNIMRHFRNILNKTMVFFTIFLIFSVMSFVTLFKGDRKEALRVAMKGAAIEYLSLIFIGLICFFVPPLKAFFYSVFFQYSLQENGMLTLILTDQLANKCVVGIVAISALIMFLLTYLTQKLTQPRRMFKQHY